MAIQSARVTKSIWRSIWRSIWQMALATAGIPSLTPAQAPIIEPAVRVSGSGPETYVLISGLMGGLAGYRRLENVLVRHGHRVIVIDPYRLSVDSADLSFTALARRVDRVLERSQVPSARLIGHSHGGGVALRVAALNPNRVAELYLLDVGALARQKTVVFSGSLRLVPIIARIPGGKAFIKGRIVRGLRESSGHTNWLDAETQAAYCNPFITGIDRVIQMALRLSRTQEPMSLAAVVARVRSPTTVLLGEAPHIGGPVPGEMDALQPLGGLLRIEWLAGVGHFVHEEAPEAVAALILARAAPVRPSLSISTAQ